MSAQGINSVPSTLCTVDTSRRCRACSGKPILRRPVCKEVWETDGKGSREVEKYQRRFLLRAAGQHTCVFHVNCVRNHRAVRKESSLCSVHPVSKDRLPLLACGTRKKSVGGIDDPCVCSCEVLHAMCGCTSSLFRNAAEQAMVELAVRLVSVSILQNLTCFRTPKTLSSLPAQIHPGLSEFFQAA